MALYFGGVEHEFQAFTNAEESYMYANGAEAFCMQIDGRTITNWLESTRYVALTRGLCADPADASEVSAFEDLFAQCEGQLFNRLVDSHYMKQHTKGGKPQRPPDEESIANHNELTRGGIRRVFSKIESLLQSAAERPGSAGQPAAQEQTVLQAVQHGCCP